MNLLNIYIILSTFTLMFTTIIWTTRGYLNIFIKMMLTALTFLGAILSLKILSPYLGF